ncbi:MAG TPA: 16S rRNA (guanine(527)-N(7))-methyltransferase RsmG [Alphaproteobacteria bacterium]|nr:16S rRNA (guanine(527)-N(7))-methyltransferase RsmG [Alphaproteobacteria bacterium]
MAQAKEQIKSQVSRETFERLENYEKLLRQWQERINLVSASTLPDLWNRHFMDSFQLLNHVLAGVSRETCVDLGSGAGFPGMVLAIAGVANMNLIESDQRKCAFLREVSRETSAGAMIHNQRIESVNLRADIITSRAFADLAKTLEISAHLCHAKTEYLLLKPLDMDKELTETTKYWYFQHEMTPSQSDPRGAILHIWDVKRK